MGGYNVLRCSEGSGKQLGLHPHSHLLWGCLLDNRILVGDDSMKVGDLVKHKYGKGNSNIGVVLRCWPNAAKVYWFGYESTKEHHHDNLERINESR
jgi:hypothetical protein